MFLSDCNLGVPVGQYVGVLSHSGSRGLGAGIAEHYTKLANGVCQLPTEAQYSWLGSASTPKPARNTGPP